MGPLLLVLRRQNFLQKSTEGSANYLLNAFRTSITTRTDRAIVLDFGLSNILQSMPLKFSGSPWHCMKCVYKTYICDSTCQQNARAPLACCRHIFRKCL